MTKPNYAPPHFFAGDEAGAENPVGRYSCEPRDTKGCVKTASRGSAIRRFARCAAVLSLVTLTAGCPWDEAGPMIREGMDHIPGELPKPESPPLKPPPLFDQGLTFAQQRLEKFMLQLEDGTFQEKRVKSAACSAMRAAHDQIDPQDDQAWENRIYSYLPELPDDRTQLRVVHTAVHNVASRLSMAGSNYYPVYLRVCGPV